MRVLCFSAQNNVTFSPRPSHPTLSGMFIFSVPLQGLIGALSCFLQVKCDKRSTNCFDGNNKFVELYIKFDLFLCCGYATAHKARLRILKKRSFFMPTRGLFRNHAEWQCFEQTDLLRSFSFPSAAGCLRGRMKKRQISFLNPIIVLPFFVPSAPRFETIVLQFPPFCFVFSLEIKKSDAFASIKRKNLHVEVNGERFREKVNFTSCSGVGGKMR